MFRGYTPAPASPPQSSAIPPTNRLVTLLCCRVEFAPEKDNVVYCMATTGPAGPWHVNTLRPPAVLLSVWWFCLKISTLSLGQNCRVSPCTFTNARRAIVNYSSVLRVTFLFFFLDIRPVINTPAIQVEMFKPHCNQPCNLQLLHRWGFYWQLHTLRRATCRP